MRTFRNSIFGSVSLVTLLALTGCEGGGGGTTTSPTVTTAPPVTIKLSKVTADPVIPSYSYMMYDQKMTIKVTDSTGKIVPDQTINWSANGGGWAVPATIKTDSSGVASVRWFAGDTATPTLTASTANAQGTASNLTFNGQTKPDGLIDGTNAPGININLHWNNQNITGFSSEMTPLDEATGTYFAMNWTGGYTGIQRGGSHFDRQVQFSVWNVNNIRSSIVKMGVSTCQDFGNEGFGVACQAQYEWAVNKAYRFEMTTAAVVSGYLDITVHVIDVSTGAKVFLATLRQAKSDFLSNTGFFVEDFKRDYLGCKNVPEKSMTVGKVKVLTSASNWVDATVVARLAHAQDPTRTCANSGYTKNADGSVTMGMGGTTKFKTTNTTGQWESM